MGRKFISILICCCLILSSILIFSGCDDGDAESFVVITPLPSGFTHEDLESAAEAEQTPSVSEEAENAPHELSLGEQIAEYALQFEGYKYVYGGETPEDGFDCSGLIWYVFRQFGYKMFRVAKDQATNGEDVEKDVLLPGDIVLFSKGKTINHCGIYLGDGMFIHAMDKEHGVVVTSLDEWIATRNLTSRRIVGVMERMTLDEIIRIEQEEYEYQEYLKSIATPEPTHDPSIPYAENGEYTGKAEEPSVYEYGGDREHEESSEEAPEQTESPDNTEGSAESPVEETPAPSQPDTAPAASETASETPSES